MNSNPFEFIDSLHTIKVKLQILETDGIHPTTESCIIEKKLPFGHFQLFSIILDSLISFNVILQIQKMIIPSFNKFIFNEDITQVPQTI